MMKAGMLILLLALPLVAQQPAAPALSEAEQKQWQQFAATEQQLNQRLQQVVAQARQLDGSDDRNALKFLAAVKDLLAALDRNEAARAITLEKWRGAKKCPDCAVSADGKTFAPLKPQP